MSDPKRWLDDPDADMSDFERTLLEEGQGMDPPADAKDKLWRELNARIESGGGSSGDSGTSGATSTGSSGPSISGMTGVVKAGWMVLAGVTFIAGVIAAFVSSAPEVPVTNPAPPNLERVAPPVAPAPADSALPIDEPAPTSAAKESTESVRAAPSIRTSVPHASSAPAKSAATTASAEAPETPAPSERSSRLHEESRLLREARTELRGGRALSALQKLEQLREQFPDGILGQEREALAIEALAQSGRRSAAATRAEAFLQAHPSSPHATKIRSFLP